MFLKRELEVTRDEQVWISQLAFFASEAERSFSSRFSNK